MSFTAETVSAEMQAHVGSVVALSPEKSRKEALNFAAALLKLPFCRVKSLFYGEARRIEAHEADQIRAYVYAAQKLIEARADYEKQRKEFLESASPNMARLVPPEVVVPDGGDDETEVSAVTRPAHVAQGE